MFSDKIEKKVKKVKQNKNEKTQEDRSNDYISNMATTTINPNPSPGGTGTTILEEENDPDFSLETSDDPELEAIKARVKAMEMESKRLKQMQSEIDQQMEKTSPKSSAAEAAAEEEAPFDKHFYEEKVEADARSVFVGNVDYGTTGEELEQHFNACGGINRVTILTNKFDGSPKGFAYIEFDDKDSVEIAMTFDETPFRGRLLKVMPKRTNTPGISSTNRPPRGQGYRGARGYRGRGELGAIYRARYGGRGYYSPY